MRMVVMSVVLFCSCSCIEVVVAAGLRQMDKACYRSSCRLNSFTWLLLIHRDRDTVLRLLKRLGKHRYTQAIRKI